jgi:hypothetical protein
MTVINFKNSNCHKLFVPKNQFQGCALAEAVSRWLPFTAARVRGWVWQVGFVVDKMASGQVFCEYFDFPCQNISFRQLLLPHNHPGRVQYARSSRSAEWTQYGLHPPIFK